MKKILASALTISLVCGAATAVPMDAAFAQYRDWGHRRPPPPPPRHRHRDNTGAVIAGGLAAGVLGGIIGGALANGGEPRYYVEEVPPPPPRPRCWFEDRQVPNAYDGGWHMESIRVCR